MAILFDKLDDDALDAVSGGVKVNVGSKPVQVYNNKGQVFRILYQGDYFVTDGSGIWYNGVYYCHILMAHDDGYVNSNVF